MAPNLPFNPGVQAAGQSIGAEMRNPGGGQPSPITSPGSNKFSVDYTELTGLRQEVKGLVTDIAQVETALKSLVSTLKSASPTLGMLGGGGPNAAPRGGSGLTVAGFGGSGAPPGNRNTAAPVSAGPVQNGLNRAASVLSFGAAGEMVSGAAGALNGYMNRNAGPGMASQLMSTQTNAVFGQSTNQFGAGGVTATSQAIARQRSLSPSDLAQAQSIQMGNAFLWTKTGSQNQKNKTGFINAAQGLNPSMGAAGASQFANTLASAGAMQVSNRYLGANAGALLRPKGGINNPATTFAAIMQILNKGRKMSSMDLKSMATQNSVWAGIAANFGTGTQMNLTDAEINAMRQYAAAGGNLGAAEASQSGTTAGTSLQATSAKSRLSQSLYQGRTGVTNEQNRVTARGANMAANQADNHPNVVEAGAAAAKLASAALSAASGLAHVAEFGAAIKYMMSSGPLASILAKMGIGGSAAGAGGDAAAGVGAAGAADVGGEVAVGAAGAAGTAGAVGAGIVAAPIASIGLGIWAATHAKQGRKNAPIQRYARKLHNNRLDSDDNFKYVNEPTKDPNYSHAKWVDSMGDPPTGSTSTAGMKPGLARRISAMKQVNPALQISSGHRTASQQAYLYAAKGGRGVAPPGHSAHQRGEAADLGPPSQFGWIARNASKFGLGRPDPSGEPWHVQAMGDPPAQTGANATAIASSVIGTPYSWGGGGAGGATKGIQQGANTVGFDCSGLMVYIFAKLGITLPRTSEAQASQGTAVNGLTQAQAGDLLFYNYGSANDHVALYIGGGKQIAAPHTGTTVQTQSVDTAHLIGIRRVLSGGAGSSVVSAAKNTVGMKSTDSQKHAGSGDLGGSFLSTISSTWLNSGMGSGGGGGAGGAGSDPNSPTASTTTTTAPTGGASGATPNLSTTPTSTGYLSASAVYQLAIQAGLSPKNAQIATAVANVESKFNPTAVDHDSNGTTDYGLWQINSVHGVGTNMFSPGAAAAEMAKLTSNGQNWGPWAPDFGSANYGGNPQVGGKVQAAMQALGFMGDPGMDGGGAGAGGFSASPVTLRGAKVPGVRGGMSGGGGVTVHAPITIMSASAQEAQRFVQMVVQELKNQAGIDAMAGN